MTVERTALAPREGGPWGPDLLLGGLGRTLEALRRDLEDLFLGPRARPSGGERTYYPPVDVIERADELLVRAWMPGFPKDRLEVEVADGVLEIRAEAEGKARVEEYHHLNELDYARARRSVYLPVEVRPDEVEARLEDGVLEVRLPKKEPGRVRRAHRVRVR